MYVFLKATVSFVTTAVFPNEFGKFLYLLYVSRCFVQLDALSEEAVEELTHVIASQHHKPQQTKALA